MSDENRPSKQLLSAADDAIARPDTFGEVRAILVALKAEIVRLQRFERMYQEATAIQGDDEVLLYVKSGNSIPVTRCTVSADLIRQLVEGRRASAEPPAAPASNDRLAELIEGVGRLPLHEGDELVSLLKELQQLRAEPPPAALVFELEFAAIDILRRYGRHLPQCPALASDGPNAPYPCNCGLDEVLRLPSTKSARRFTGPGHLEETGYVPAGSAAERAAVETGDAPDYGAGDMQDDLSGPAAQRRGI